MYNIEVHYIGGSNVTLTCLTEENMESFYKWLDNDKGKGAWHLHYEVKNKKVSILRQAITYTVLTECNKG